jgi:hypothetical protein
VLNLFGTCVSRPVTARVKNSHRSKMTGNEGYSRENRAELNACVC